MQIAAATSLRSSPRNPDGSEKVGAVLVMSASSNRRRKARRNGGIQPPGPAYGCPAFTNIATRFDAHGKQTYLERTLPLDENKHSLPCCGQRGLASFAFFLADIQTGWGRLSLLSDERFATLVYVPEPKDGRGIGGVGVGTMSATVPTSSKLWSVLPGTCLTPVGLASAGPTEDTHASKGDDCDRSHSDLGQWGGRCRLLAVPHEKSRLPRHITSHLKSRFGENAIS